MKKLLLIFALLFALTACGKKNEPAANEAANNSANSTNTEAAADATEGEDKKPVVTCTTSFLYDMANQLAGDYIERQLIIPAGEDPHLYVAKSEDTKKISEADLVLYHGLHFEGKMVDILEKYGVNLSENFPEDKIGQMDEDGEMVTDPHFWFDIDLYKMATENASKALQEAVPDHKDDIQKNTDDYLQKLDDLKKYNEEQLAKIPEGQRYLITPHDAFNYFSRAYNIEVVAPQGVSTDSEVASKDVQETVDFIVEHKVPAIFAESTTDPARMEKLKESCKAKGFDVKVVSGEDHELFSDSLAQEGKPGDSYIDMYKHNVDLIVENLS